MIMRPHRRFAHAGAVLTLLLIPPLAIAEPGGAPRALVSSSAPAAAALEETAYVPTAFVRAAPLWPRRDEALQARHMSLQDAIALSVQNNLGISLRRQQLAIDRHGLRAARGRFEPALGVRLRHTDTDSPPTTLQEGMPGQVQTVVTDSWSLSYSQPLRFGTNLGLDFENVRSNSSLDSAVEPLLYSSRVQLRLTQPLLQGFAFDLDLPYAEVLRAELDSEQARQAVLSTVIDTVRDTEQAYWGLFQALKAYEVQLASLGLADEQVALTERQIDAGIRPPYDRVNAAGTVAERRLGLLRAEANVDAAADRLRYLLNLSRDEWSEPLLPSDAPDYRDLHLSLEVALRAAIARRPELAQSRLALERAELDVRVAKNRRLPRLDAEVTYGWVGQDPGYRETLDQLVTTAAPGWSALLNFSWTPLNREADARYQALSSAAGAARVELDQRVLDLQLELSSALRALTNAARALRVAARVRELAEQSLEVEQRKYESGDGSSSSFFIAQRQEALARAQLDELAALIAHRQAKAALQASMGVLLDERGVKLTVRGE